LTVSVGVGGFEPRLHADGDALYHAVDQALYRAKASGRNTVREATVTSAV
jgi:PleD family two-component response regulator